MAALLGNMGLPAAGQQQPQAAYGGGLQPPMRAFNPTGQPIPPGGAGYPQMSPAMQTMMGQLSAGGAGVPQARQGAEPGGPMQAGLGGQETPSYFTSGPKAGGFQPMPSLGAPGGGAAGKAPGMKQAIGQLPGGPPMQQRLGGALGNRMPRPRPQGMQPPNPMMRR
jgi:hypothetical protein